MAEEATADQDLRCRACLVKASPKASNVFDAWNNGNSTIAFDLAKVTGIIILESDPYSKRMCHSCCFKLHSARMFVDMVHKSDRELKELDNDMDKETDKDSTGECWPKPIQLDKNVNDAVFGNVQVPHLIQIKEEILSDDDNFDANAADCNLDLDIKIEPEEITESTPIKITVNDSGEQIVTIFDDENDPLTLNNTDKCSYKIRLNKKRRITKENLTVFGGSDVADDEQFVKRVKTTRNVYKSKRIVLSRPDSVHRIINETMGDYRGRTNTLKTQNKSISEMRINLEDVKDLPQSTCTLVSRSINDYKKRSIRNTVLQKITNKTLNEECTRIKNDDNSENADIDLILEVEDEQPTIEAIAKKIAINVKVKPRYLSKAERKRKYLKCCGKAYVTKSGIMVPPKSLGPPCSCGKATYCKKFTQEQRQYIFETYWGFEDPHKQSAFIIKFTTKFNKNLPGNSGKRLVKRNFIYRYYLPITEDLNGEKVRVCKKMFYNTLSANLSTSNIWRKYENTCDLRCKNLKTKRDHDKIASVCEHFRILQKSKLALLKQSTAGLYTNRMETFGIKKMFSQYRDWLDGDKYSDKAQTWPEYEQILARNISQEQILTLQQGDGKMNSNTNNKKDCKIWIEFDNIKKVNSETNVVFRPDYEESVCESIHSSFCDELREVKSITETDPSPENNKVKEEKAENEEKIANGKTSKSDATLEKVEDSVKTRKCIQGRKLPEQKDGSEVAENIGGVNYTFGHIVIGESLGRQFVTTRGKLIMLRPPCSCKLKCFDKITERQREFIFNHFWGLGKRSNQWSFVLQFTSRKKPKSVARAHFPTTSHKYRFNYFLPLTEIVGKDGETVKVCQTMFIQTLVISGRVVVDSWARLSGLKDKRGPRMNTKDDQDLNEKIEQKKSEINNFNVQDYTLRKVIVDDQSIDEIELDNTQVDFIYRSLPWGEYLNAVSAKAAKEETILDSSIDLYQEDNGKKNSKRKRCRNKIGKLGQKSLGSPCNCFRRCSEKIDEEQRIFIFNFYWNLDAAQQWAFLVRFTERCSPERRSTDPTVLYLRRQYSFKFFLPISNDLDGEKVQVCKVMMCNTLAIANTVRRAWRYFSKGKLMDKRGRYRVFVTDETRDSVKEHLHYLQGFDPDLQGYKFSKVGWLKFKRMYRNYEQWLESSQYSMSCKPSLHRYRILLYQALNLSVPGTITLHDMTEQCSISNNGQVYENEEYLDTPVKVEPMSEDEQDLSMDCLLCAKRFMSISGLKAHVIAQHNYKTVRRKTNNGASPEKKNTAKNSCTTCGRNFVTLTDLMVHETCHNKSVCYACGGKFDSYGLLMKHHRRWCKKLKNSSSKPKYLENVMTPFLPTSVQTQNEPPVTLKCSDCNEEFSDLHYLKVHGEIHNTDKVNNKNDQLQNNEQFNSSDVNTSECDENCETTTDQDVNEQTNNYRDIEINLEITNVVTLKDQLDYMLDNSETKDNETEEEANEDSTIHKSYETGKSPEIIEIRQDSVVKNNEQLTNDNELIGQNCLKSSNIDNEAITTVGQDENTIDLFQNNDNFEVDHSKTNEDSLMVNNKNKDDNDMVNVIKD